MWAATDGCDVREDLIRVTPGQRAAICGDDQSEIRDSEI